MILTPKWKQNFKIGKKFSQHLAAAGLYIFLLHAADNSRKLELENKIAIFTACM
jgi:hypothetical protein